MLDPFDHPAADQYPMAPYCSDPERTLRPGQLMVVSMKPYGARSKTYPDARQERKDNPGLHRWYDGDRSGSNFVKEADKLLRALLEQLELDTEPRDVFSTYAYFFRAPDARTLQDHGLEKLDCSPYHRDFLKRIQPRVILCIGNGPAPSAYATYRDLLKPEKEETVHVAPRVLIRHFSTLEGILVIGVSHLSYQRAENLIPAVNNIVSYYQI